MYRGSMLRAPTHPPRTARREATRDRLLEAAQDAFSDKGFHGASVEDICERAGFTRGAFYSNFTSKDDLVIELARREGRDLVQRIERVAALPNLEPSELLDRMVAAVGPDPARAERWHLLVTEFELHAIREPSARAPWARQQREARQAIGALVHEAVTRHHLTLPMPVDTFVRILLALSRGSVSQRLVEPRAVRRNALERAVLPVLLGTGSTDGNDPPRV